MRSAFRAEPLVCAVNFMAGRESTVRFEPSDRARKVLVVGGGPAGMEAARVAALRGHKVQLYEKERWLGGLLVYASMLQSDIGKLITYLKTELKRLQVRVKLGVEVMPALIEEIKPDVVILAVGAQPALPQIPRIDGKNVVRSSEIWETIGHRRADKNRPSKRDGIKVLEEIVKPGGRVIVVGGELIGCTLAEFWAERGRKVTVVESGKRLGRDMAQTSIWKTMRSFEKNGVITLPRVEYDQINDRGLTVTTVEGQPIVIEADTVILVDGVGVNRDLLQAIEGKVKEVYAVGDCTQKSMIQGAIADANAVALRI